MIGTREDIRRAAGRSIFCGFDGTQVSAELREILREVKPSGLILFARNVESPEQVAELGRELKSMRADDPLLLSVDQEGGRVARIRTPATLWPSMRTVGEHRSVEMTERLARALAAELRAMNFDINFAPVLDVDTNPDNPVIGDRSFSDDPAVVAELGAAFVRGMQAADIGACGKHFPGHGDTDVDSHHDLPRVAHSPDRLREIEWPPFVAAVAAGVGAIMTAHVIVEALDDETPATLSPAALAPLREALGFDGVIVSDDLEMKAVADRYRVEQMATLGMNAGVDLFLACHDPEVILNLYRGIIVGTEQEEISHDTLLGAEKRIDAWRERFYRRPAPPDALGTVGCAEHEELARAFGARPDA